MFILFFLVFTLIFTLFENILLAGIFLVLAISGLAIYQSVSGKKILKKQMIFSLLGAFLLAGFAFGIKERRYSVTSDEWWVTRRWNKNTFIGTGIISDINNQGKYVFEVEKREYLLYSENDYAIGDRIWLVGSMDSGQIPAAKLNAKYRTITSWTFVVPLFSWGFDYPKRLKMKGRKGTIYEKNSITNYEWPMTNEVWIIQSMKKSIQEKVIRAYGENKISGLILGMLIGDKSEIPEVEYQEFVDSWLVHLIAVSGGNILMIVVFLQFVLFFLPFYVRITLILITITGYSLICGMDSSVFRALLMGGLSMVALFRWREINIRRLLSMSAIIMLLINPYFLVYDVGFLLSYSALIGIVYFNEKTTKRENDETAKKEKTINPPSASADSSPFLKRGQKAIVYIYKNYVSPSIGASIGIFPIMIFFMGKINLVGIIGNLLVLPIVPFVMIYGFLSVYLYQFFGWSRLLWSEKILIQYIYKISEFLTTYGLYISVTGLWMKYLILAWCLAGFLRWRLKQK